LAPYIFRRDIGPNSQLLDLLVKTLARIKSNAKKELPVSPRYGI